MKLSAHSIRDRRQSGQALLLAALMGIMGFGLWATAYRATQDATGLAATEAGRSLRLEVLTEAMARAGHLLESGVPPYSSYSCVSRHRTEAGEWQAVVESRLATEDELRKLPAAPSMFRSEQRDEQANQGRTRSSRSSRITPAGSRGR
jgi:hypothetical protein